MAFRNLGEIPDDVERVDQMSAEKGFVVHEALDSGSHARLLVSYEGSGVASWLNKSLKDLAKSWSSLFAGDCDAKGNDFVVAVNSRENADGILPFLLIYFLD